MKRYSQREIIEDFLICAFICVVGIGAGWVAVQWIFPNPTPGAVAQVPTDWYPDKEEAQQTACERCATLCKEIGIVIKDKEVDDGEEQGQLP